MPWPEWIWSKAPTKADDEKRQALTPERPPYKPTGTWERNLNKIDWSEGPPLQTITACIITTATALTLVRVYKRYFRRIPSADYLKPDFFRKRSLYGYVSRVGDGDNFHFFHTPGGRLAGWGWLPGRRMQEMPKAEFKDKTLHVRIAGVDAPEMAHFGKTAQPYGQEALDWLHSYILHRYVRVYLYRRDQYGRVVGTAYRRKWLFFKSDIGHEMLRHGWATVYEAKMGREFGGKEEEYRATEARAKQRKIGMWQEPGLVGKLLGQTKASIESPREYKTRTTAEEKSSKGGDGKK